MVSRNPMECLPLPKTAKKHEKMQKMPSGPWGGPWAPLFPPVALRCGAAPPVHFTLVLIWAVILPGSEVCKRPLRAIPPQDPALGGNQCIL